jgi:hypothetical protein
MSAVAVTVPFKLASAMKIYDYVTNDKTECIANNFKFIKYTS